MTPKKALEMGTWLMKYGTGDIEYTRYAGNEVIYFTENAPELSILDKTYGHMVHAMTEALKSININVRWESYTQLSLIDRVGRVFRP